MVWCPDAKGTTVAVQIQAFCDESKRGSTGVCVCVSWSVCVLRGCCLRQVLGWGAKVQVERMYKRRFQLMVQWMDMLYVWWYEDGWYEWYSKSRLTKRLKGAKVRNHTRPKHRLARRHLNSNLPDNRRPNQASIVDLQKSTIHSAKTIAFSNQQPFRTNSQR